MKNPLKSSECSEQKQLSPSISHRVLSGSLYLSTLRWIDRGSSILSAVVLARLLDPIDFGLVALAMTAISLLKSLTEVSLNSGLIYRSDCDREYYDVAWTYGRVLRGSFVFTVLYVSAPYVAHFYDENRLIAVLRVLAVCELFNGATNVGIVDFIKKMDFRKDFFFGLSSKLARIVVVIPLAFLLRDVWALVIGTLMAAGVSLFMSYYMHPFRPRLNFDLQRARKLFEFGVWLLGVQLINMVQGTIDRIFIGRLLGVFQLGYYQIAIRFGGEIPSEMKSVVSQVMFPAYSLLRHDPKKMAEAFRQVLSISLILSLPICIGLSLTADYFVILILGPKWEPAIPVMRILAVAGCLNILCGTGRPLYRGAGKPRLELVVTLVQLFITIAIMFPLTRNFGSIGTACAVFAGLVFAVPLWWTFSRYISKLSRRDMVYSILPSLIITTLMTCGVLFVRHFSRQVISWQSFGACILVGALISFFCAVILWRVFKIDSMNILFGYLHRALLLIKK